jgi:hypothetical protein
MPFQKREELFLEGDLPMMLGLPRQVIPNLVPMRLTANAP